MTPSVSGNSPHRDVESSSAPIFQRRSEIHPWKASWGWELLHGLPMMGFLHSGRCIIAESWPEPVCPFCFVPGSEYRAELTLGGVDKSKFIGVLIWTDLNRNANILSEAYTLASWVSTSTSGLLSRLATTARGSRVVRLHCLLLD